MEIVIVVAVVLVLVAVGFITVAAKKRRRGQLKEQFGPEYEHVVESAESRRSAERELADRQRRRDQLDVRPLSPGARERYAEEWSAVQARFVDVPGDAVRDAKGLLTAVMRDRGYPVEDFEERASLISVDHPTLVANYRAAARVSELNSRGTADTEELRQALVHYRSLFDELLVDGTAQTERALDHQQATTSSSGNGNRSR